MYYTLNAIILKRQNFKDDDLLITVYSLERGKIILQAKGAKRIKSKLAGHLEPLTLSNLNITHGKYIDQLIGAQIIKSYYQIKSAITLIGYANYFIELIYNLTQEDHPDKQIFVLLKKSLDFLTIADDSSYKIARISFGFKLLHLLGFDSSVNTQLALNSEISYIVKNTIDLISCNKNVIKKLSQINKILDQELEQQLEQEVKTKEFLKQII